MSDTNRVRVSVAKTGASVIPIADQAAPAGAQSLTQLRLTGTPNLASNPQTLISNEIRPDREIADLIQVGVEAGGDIGFEQSFGALERIHEAVFFSTYSTVESTSATGGAGAALTIGAAGNWADNMILRADGFSSGDGVYLIGSGGGTTTLTMANLTGVGTPDFVGTGTITLAGARILAVTAALSVSGRIGTLTVTGTDFTSAAFGSQGAGDWFELSASPGGAFDNAGNSGLFRASAVAAGTVTLEMPDGVTEDFDENIDLMVGVRIRPGVISVANSSLIVERAYTDHENDNVAGRYTRELFVGMAASQFTEQLQPQNIATAAVTLFGLRAFSRAQNVSAQLYANADLQAIPFNAVAGTTAGLNDSPQNQVYNTAGGVARIGRGDTNLVDPSNTKNLVNDLTLTINNNLRRRLAVGRFGTASIGLGELNSSLGLGTYFDDNSILTDVLTDGFRTAINWALRAGDGRANLTDFPNCAFSAGAPDVPGKNQDVTMPLTAQALRDPTLGYSAHKAQFEYLAIAQ